MSEIEKTMRRCYWRCVGNEWSILPGKTKLTFTPDNGAQTLTEYLAAIDQSTPKLLNCVRQVNANFPSIRDISIIKTDIEDRFRDLTKHCSSLKDRDLFDAQSEADLNVINVKFTRCVLQLAEIKQLVYGQRLR